MKVLIVDDERNNRIMLSKILEAHGFEVAEATNGKEALDSVAESPPYFIISDILMPVMDGFQLCRELKRDNRSKDIPLIFYTASYTEKEDEKLAMDLGALAFIRKPEEPRQFIEKINKILMEYDAGKLMPVKPVLADEKVYLTTYSQRLLKKLEDKIIELEKSNKKLETACDELKTVDRLKDNIIANVTHELRTPLMHAQGYLELAIDEKDEHKRMDYLNKCMSALKRENKVISNLIETAYAEKGLLKPVICDIDVKEMIESTVDDLRPKAVAYEIDISSLVEEGLMIRGGRSQIKHVLNNLLDNAIKFNKKGGKVKIIAGHNKEGHVQICLEDTGIGIPIDEKDRVFNRIYQVESDSNRRYGGVGLGLAISKYIVESHGGRIWVESKEGDGSKFYFEIPEGKK